MASSLVSFEVRATSSEHSLDFFFFLGGLEIQTVKGMVPTCCRCAVLIVEPSRGALTSDDRRRKETLDA